MHQHFLQYNQALKKNEITTNYILLQQKLKYCYLIYRNFKSVR